MHTIKADLKGHRDEAGDILYSLRTVFYMLHVDEPAMKGQSSFTFVGIYKDFSSIQVLLYDSK